MTTEEEIKLIFALANKSITFSGEADSETVGLINAHKSFSPEFVVGLFNVLAGIGRERAGLIAKIGAQVERDLNTYIQAEEAKIKTARLKGGRATAKNAEKEEAHRCWIDWQEDKVRYKNQEAFVLDMQNKLAVSRQTLISWLKEWKALQKSTNA